jgi:hypothetical protein
MFGNKGSKTTSPSRDDDSSRQGETRAMMWSRSRSRQIPTSRGKRRYEAVSRSCPAKPVIGSMPEPGMKDSVPPLTLPPTPSSSFDSQQATVSSSMSRSLFSGQTNFGNVSLQHNNIYIITHKQNKQNLKYRWQCHVLLEILRGI